MEVIKTYIGYIVGILGFAGIVWTMATKTAGKDYSVANLKADLTELKANAVTKDDISKVVDNALYNQLAPIIQNQNALRSSYILHLYDSKVSIDKFTKYLNGIQFELNIPSATDTVKIKITKVEPNGK